MDFTMSALSTPPDQQIEAGDRRRPRSGAHQLDFGDVLVHHPQAIQYGGAGDDRRAVLVVVEDRNLHALAQRFLD
jgi:ABC-type nitrate/sulfonate/bicarbonate transport system substrate-binding protein